MMKNEAKKEVKANQGSHRKRILKSSKGIGEAKNYIIMQRLKTLKDNVAQYG